MSLDLAARAGEFGEELQQLLDAVLPYQVDTDPDLRQVTVTEAGLAFAVEIGTAKAGEAQPIPLLCKSAKVAELLVTMRLVADSAARHPAVSRSRMVVRVDRRNPLLRLDYEKDMHTVPGCHWNVHAERSALTRVLAQSNPSHNGELSKIHLPVGGFRMRPSIEDVLQMLLSDFRFDSLPGAQAAIDAGRIRWRRRQLAAMIRDDAPDLSFNPLISCWAVLAWARVLVLPTSWRGARCWLGTPGGRPGPGRLGFGALAGTVIFGRRRRNPRRTRAGVSRPGG